MPNPPGGPSPDSRGPAPDPSPDAGPRSIFEPGGSSGGDGDRSPVAADDVPRNTDASRSDMDFGHEVPLPPSHDADSRLSPPYNAPFRPYRPDDHEPAAEKRAKPGPVDSINTGDSDLDIWPDGFLGTTDPQAGEITDELPKVILEGPPASAADTSAPTEGTGHPRRRILRPDISTPPTGAAGSGTPRTPASPGSDRPAASTSGPAAATGSGGAGSSGPRPPRNGGPGRTGGGGETGGTDDPDDVSGDSEPAVVTPSAGGAPTPGAATATLNRPSRLNIRGRFTGRRTGAEPIDPDAVRKEEEALTEALRIRTEQRQKRRDLRTKDREKQRASANDDLTKSLNEKVDRVKKRYQHRLNIKKEKDKGVTDKEAYLKTPEAIAAAKARSEMWKRRRDRVSTTYKAGRTHSKGVRGWTPPIVPGTARFFATQAKDARETIFKDKEASKIYYRSLLFISRTMAYAIEKVSRQVEKHPKSAVIIGIGAYTLNKTGIGFPGWDGIPGVDLKDHLPDWDWLPDFMEGHSPSDANHGAKEMLSAQDLNLPPAKPATTVSNPLGLTMPPLNGQPSPGGITSEVVVNAQNASTMSEVGQTFANVGRQIINEFGDTGRQAWDWLTQHDYIRRDPVHGGYVISGLGDNKGSIPSDVYHRLQELLSGADDELSELYNNARN